MKKTTKKVLVLENMSMLEDVFGNYVRKHFDNKEHEFHLMTGFSDVKPGSEELAEFISRLKWADIVVFQSMFVENTMNRIDMLMDLFLTIKKQRDIIILHGLQELPKVLSKSFNEQQRKKLVQIFEVSSVYEIRYDGYQINTKETKFFKQFEYYFDTVKLYYNKEFDIFVHERRVCKESILEDFHTKDVVFVEKGEPVQNISKWDVEVLKDILGEVLLRETDLMEQLTETGGVGITKREAKKLIREKVKWIDTVGRVLSTLK